MTCFFEPKWPYIFGSMFVTYIGGFLLILIRWLIRRVCSCNSAGRGVTSRHGNSAHRNPQRSNNLCLPWLRRYANDLVAGETSISKLLITSALMMNIASVTLFVIDAADQDISTCGNFLSNPRQQLDVILNAGLLIYFFIRLLAAREKFRFWIEINTIVDHMTIAPCFVAAYFGQNWIGFRYMRIMSVMFIPEVLQFLHILRDRKRIRMAQVVCSFCAIWWSCSGFVYLIENMGDPWHGFGNGPGMTFWDSVYYLLVTMSTVGYGDISCKTDIGKLFILIFIVGSFVMFTRLIPEFVNALNRPPKLSGHYSMVPGKRHIVISGHFSLENLKAFVKEFRQHKGHFDDTNIVVVDREYADISKKAYLRRHQWHVCHVIGSILEKKTLASVKVDQAEAVILLADYKSESHAEDDAANLLRVAALKAFHPNVRVVVQINDRKQKVHLTHIPGWDTENGDQVVCQTQLGQTLLARACVSPGSATLLCNLLNSRPVVKLPCSSETVDKYRRGANMRLLSSYFSPAFYGLTFLEAVNYCYSKFRIVLIGIDNTSTSNGVLINPNGYEVIRFDTLGYFIAEDEDIVERMRADKDAVKADKEVYRVSRENSTSVDIFKTGPVFSDNIWSIPNSPQSTCSENSRAELMNGDALQRYSSPAVEYFNNKRRSSADPTDQCPDRSFLRCLSRPFSECRVGKDDSCKPFSNHVILWITRDADWTAIDLSLLIQPMRSSARKAKDVKDVIIVGNEDCVQSQWNQLENLPDVYYYPEVTSLSESDVDALCLRSCATCLVLSPRMRTVSVDGRNIDKDVVIQSIGLSSFLSDASNTAIDTIEESRSHMNRYKCGSNTVQLLTNIESLDTLTYFEENLVSSNLPSSLSFACGRIFSPRVLDCLVAGTYICHQLPDVVMRLATGAHNTSSGNIKCGGHAGEASQLELLPVSEGVLSSLPVDGTYDVLFTQALRRLQIICLGIYRVEKHDTNAPCRRYVVTNPSPELEIQSSDQIFCLRPYKLEESGSEIFNEFNNVQSMLFEVCREMQISEITSL